MRILTGAALVLTVSCSGLTIDCNGAERVLGRARALLEVLVEAEPIAANAVADLCIVDPVPQQCAEARAFLADVRYRLAQARAMLVVAELARDRLCGTTDLKGLDNRLAGLTDEERAYVDDLRALECVGQGRNHAGREVVEEVKRG